MANPPSKPTLNDDQTPQDNYMFDNYPPPSSMSMEGIPHSSEAYRTVATRGMDGFLKLVITFVAVIAVFGVLVALLMSIPNSHNSMDLSPGVETGDRQGTVVEPEIGIIGDES